MSVNLSAVQVAQPRARRRRRRRCCAATGLDPACLSLEITESVMVGDAERPRRGAARARRRLGRAARARRLRHRLLVAQLPDAAPARRAQDRPLVRRRPRARSRADTAITEAIVAMSRALSLDVVAEGVETAEQVARARAVWAASSPRASTSPAPVPGRGDHAGCSSRGRRWLPPRRRLIRLALRDRPSCAGAQRRDVRVPALVGAVRDRRRAAWRCRWAGSPGGRRRWRSRSPSPRRG